MASYPVGRSRSLHWLCHQVLWAAHGGLGVAQTQYAQTGGLNYRNLPRILLQGFIALWSGGAVGPEGTLVFLTGGLGTFLSERLKLQKDDVQVLVYSAIAGAFGGFFGSPIVGAIGAVEVTCSSRS